MIHNFEATMLKIIEFGLLTDEETKEYNEFMLFIEKNLKTETQYMQFLREFNRITGKKYTGDITSRQLFYQTVGAFSLADKIKAVNNAMTDKWLISPENITRLTPKYILDNENLSKYYSYKGSDNATKEDTGKHEFNAVEL